MPHDITLQIDIAQRTVRVLAHARPLVPHGIATVLHLPIQNSCNGSVGIMHERWRAIAISHLDTAGWPYRSDYDDARYVVLPCQPSATSPTGHTIDLANHQNAVAFSRFALAGFVAECKLRALSLAVNAPNERAQEEPQ